MEPSSGAEIISKVFPFLDVDSTMFLRLCIRRYTLYLYMEWTHEHMQGEKCSECGCAITDSRQIIEHFLKTGHQSLINPSKKSV